MAGQPRQDGEASLDKLSKDVSLYRKMHSAGKPQGHAKGTARVAGATAGERPGWTELDRNLSSQIVVGLLITGYAILMLAATLGVLVKLPAASMVLWLVMAAGVLTAMIAYQKGRPPLLWFMYGSILPMGPVGHAALMRGAGASLGELQGLLGGGGQASGGGADLLVSVCVLGAIPVLHAALAPQGIGMLESRQLASGLRKCPHCAEMVKPDASVCRFCGNDLPRDTRGVGD